MALLRSAQSFTVSDVESAEYGMILGGVVLIDHTFDIEVLSRCRGAAPTQARV